MRKFLVILVVLTLIGGGGAWFWSGRAEGPRIEIRGPERFVGQATPLTLVVESPGGRFARVDVTIEQGGRSYPVFALTQPAQAEVRQESADRLYIMRSIGKREVPQLQPGPARLVVRAAQPVLFGLREATSEASRDLEVRLEPPRVAVLSTLHYINHGGAEFVVYRATPAGVESGVRVGDQTYPGFPASGAGIRADAATKVAFFALLHDQELRTPIAVYARDAAANEATAPLEHVPFAKSFARSRIAIDDRFLNHVVPQIAAATPAMPLSTAPGDLLASFLTINGELRRRNSETILALAQKTTPEMLWKDAFQPLVNAAVESRFADNRTYVYQGKEVDRQVHLGFDLAVTEHIPVLAANDGIVLHAGDLGIYGNCVILDHGLGVQSLYAHLSSIDVKPGDRVEKGRQLGRSGMTGLAAGDHLHFTMLVGGHPVNAVEWWDAKWMRDRVLRKIAEAGGGVP
ncbi:MAG: M23 family metallopeptidase [Acidobacteria bacterium]|nr:M23 family metallopeptidase [Acidobacteriota bacterium]